jgi:hypothetical protein
MSTTIVIVIIVVAVVVILLVASVWVLMRKRREHQRVEAEGIRDRAAEQEFEVGQREALAEETAARGRAAKAEGEAKAAQAERLAQQAHVHRSEAAEHEHRRGRHHHVAFSDRGGLKAWRTLPLRLGDPSHRLSVAGRPFIGRSLAGLGHIDVAVIDFRVHTEVVERPGEDGYRNGSGARAVGRRVVVVVPLRTGDGADDQPHEHHQRH